MRDVEDDDISARFYEGRGAFQIVASNADRCADEQASFGVFARERRCRNKSKSRSVMRPRNLSRVIHEGEALDAIFEHQPLGFVFADAGWRDVEAIEGCHERVHELGVELAASRDVTIGQKTGKCPAPALSSTRSAVI